MINALLILFIILLYTMQSFFCKLFTDAYPGKEASASPFFTFVSGLFVALAAFAFSGFALPASPLTILFGAINAVMLAACDLAVIRASQTGPYSVLMVFSLSGCILIPILFNMIAFGEIPNLCKAIAILAAVVSVYFITKKSDETFKKSFYIASAILAISNGGYGVLLDLQQRVTGEGDKNFFVAVTYFGAALVGFALLLSKEKKNFFSAFRQTKRSAVYLLLCCIVTASAITLLVYLIGALKDIAILYTFESSGVLLLSVLFSCIFLGEKLSKTNVFGCILMCCALTVIPLSDSITAWISSIFA